MNASKQWRFGPRWEHKRQPILSSRKFLQRQFRFVGYSTILIGFSLFVGTVGYCHFGDMTLVDGFYNASMILTGMGPVTPLHTDAAKVFSSLYALFSGVAFLTTAAVLLAPGIHRFLHVLNLDEGKERELGD